MDTVVEARPRHAVGAGWDGTESPWVLTAWAAAPWPAWSLLSAVGTPGGAHAPAWLHGPFALASVLALMVVWAHRPSTSVGIRWALSILGSGIMAELVVAALSGQLTGVSAAPRAIGVWLVCVAVYELAPIAAAASRISPREHRHPMLDVGAHAVFLGLAVASFAWQPRHGWIVSPWMAVGLALPLTAARSGTLRATAAPLRARGGLLWIVALVCFSLVALLFAAEGRAVRETLRLAAWRGTDALDGLLLVWPTLSFFLAIIAAATLMVRAAQVRRAPSGVVRELGDAGLTLLRGSGGEPTSVAISAGPLPTEGATVTLLGARERAPDAGPFRDGAPQLVARRAWVGAPLELSRALTHRAAGWLIWAAASALGIWARLI